MLSEVNLLYYNILIKYNLCPIPIINNHIFTSKKILIMDYPEMYIPIIYSPIIIKNNNYDKKFKKKIFLSPRLLLFFHNTDYYIEEEIEYGKFVNKINYITNEINFIEIHDTDHQIYNDLLSIVGTNYTTKKLLIFKFINKYTTFHKKILINI
jgi:hypothetical protein